MSNPSLYLRRTLNRSPGFFKIQKILSSVGTIMHAGATGPTGATGPIGATGPTGATGKLLPV
jgi:hypothetical protein